MTNRRKQLYIWPLTLLALIAGFGLSETAAVAQSDAKDPLMIVPPPVPRYRRERKTFEVKADEAEKKVPIPSYPAAPAEEVPEFVPKPWVMTPAQLAKKRAKYQITVRQEAELERRDQRWQEIGKVAAFLLVAGVGVFCLRDVARQIRKAKEVAAYLSDEEETE